MLRRWRLLCTDHVACSSSLKTASEARFCAAFIRLKADEQFLVQMQELRKTLLLMLRHDNGFQSDGDSVDAADARLARYLAAPSDEMLRAAMHWPPAILRHGMAWPAHRMLLVWVPHAMQSQQLDLLHVGMNNVMEEDEKEVEEAEEESARS
jgi:hypothetical protein